MKREITLSILAIFICALSAWAEPADNEVSDASRASMEAAEQPTMHKDADGVLGRGEYEEISQNGALTRALCPYTCADRGIPKEHCRTWPSKMDPTLCYVWDTRLPNEAVPLR